METARDSLIQLIDEHLPIHSGNIGVKMSGGVDSTLAAFGLARLVQMHRLDLKLTPIVIVEYQAPFQLVHVLKILPEITQRCGTHFAEPLEFYLQPDENKTLKMRAIEKALQESQQVDLIVSGATQAPPTEDFCHSGGPDENRTGQFQVLWDNFILTPFVNINKKTVSQLYRDNDIFDSLFPLTRSCIEETTNFSKHCGKCWWCKERQWAFGTL